ncbi:MAG: 4-oxalocrotonate tautomerase family protein [Desulfarculus sp.]|jgi:4-oxalocrotonate tautomerase|nr:MAG: 4-oxalocrotonate tautomerase family protein [Desulfarculus sp.]
MPFVNVKIAKGPVTAEQKQQVIAGMTEVLFRVLGKKPESTVVLIEEISSDNWGKGGESLTTLWTRQK